MDCQKTPLCDLLEGAPKTALASSSTEFCGRMASFGADDLDEEPPPTYEAALSMNWNQRQSEQRAPQQQQQLRSSLRRDQSSNVDVESLHLEGDTQRQSARPTSTGTWQVPKPRSQQRQRRTSPKGRRNRILVLILVIAILGIAGYAAYVRVYQREGIVHRSGLHGASNHPTSLPGSGNNTTLSR